MNQPLGEYIGNSLEIYQAIKILQNEGPKDITELVVYESAKLLEIAGLAENFEKAKNKVLGVIESGEAFKKFIQLVELQK